jgi:integrase
VQANREIALLKNLFNHTKAWGLYEGENPALGVKVLEEPKRRLRYPEYDEEVKLLEVSPTLLRDGIVIGTNTGIRISAEGLSLRWSDVDFSRTFSPCKLPTAKTDRPETFC